MWYLVQVVKGSRHFDAESQVGNQVLISDTSEMVISARSLGADGCRFEMRKGNETFVVRDFKGSQAAGAMEAKFEGLAKQMGALTITSEVQ